MEAGNFPASVRRLLGDAPLVDMSGRSGSPVYYSDTDGGIFIKCAKPGELAREAQLTRQFASVGLGATVLLYEPGDFLVTRRLCGSPATDKRLLAEPERLCRLIAEGLSRLARIERRGFDCLCMTLGGGRFCEVDKLLDGKTVDTSYTACVGITDADAALAELRENFARIKQNEPVHDDFCLPNLLFDENKLCGFVDLGGAGLGDRHIDLFWAIWSLCYNLGTDKYMGLLLSLVPHDPERLKLCATLSALIDTD